MHIRVLRCKVIKVQARNPIIPNPPSWEDGKVYCREFGLPSPSPKQIKKGTEKNRSPTKQ